MKKTRTLTLVFVLFIVTTAQAGNVMIIANKNVSQNTLSRVQMQDLFLGKKAFWPDYTMINPAVMKYGPTHEGFLKYYMGMSANQFDTNWKNAIFTGTGRPPKTVSSDAEMVQYVANTNGAVGYIDSDTPHGDVKRIDVK